VTGVQTCALPISYNNSFLCLPYSVPFRPRLVTPKPVIQGVQTAVVVGNSGEELHVDKYGRVKVQFPWDREGKRDENSSCWVRVSQALAGKNWGWHFWPRIGQEVLIGFEEGDPDRPLLTGCLYNGEQMPPYELPANATQSGLKTRSSKDGSSKNFNEIKFEDKKGDELILIHAEKDRSDSVENDAFEWTGGSRNRVVKKDQFELIEKTKHTTVNDDALENYAKNLNTMVGADWLTQVGGGLSLQVSTAHKQKVGTVYALESGQEIHLKGGMKVVIEGGLQLTLKGSGGFIDIGPAGVTIQGTLVNINSGGAAGSGTDASVKAPAQAQKPKNENDKWE